MKLTKRTDSTLDWDAQVSLKHLVESVPTALAIVGRSGKIVYVNSRLEELFGYARDELLGSTIEILMPERFAARHVRHRHEFSEAPRVRSMGSGMDLVARKKDGTEFPVEVGLSYIMAGDDLLVIATVTDISKRKQVEEALEQAVAERTAAIERQRQVSDGLGTILELLNSNRSLPEILEFIVGQSCRLLQAEACCIYGRDERSGRLVVQANDGFTADEVEQLENALNQADGRGSLVSDQPMLFGDLPPALARALSHGARDGFVGSNVGSDPSNSAEEGVRVDLQLPQALRHRAYLALSLNEQSDIFGILLLGYAQTQDLTKEEIGLAANMADQTALAIANARLHAKIVTSAMAAERNRIGRDLHDAVTQTLFSASMIAEVLPTIWEHNEAEARKRLAELGTLTRGALAEMRTLLLELRPAKLIEVDIADLLRQLAEAIAGRARVPVTVEIEGKADLPTDVKIAFYRIAQESLNNVAKHARARRAHVRLVRAPDLVELTVSDDGVGFVFERIAPEHLGLGIMRERADAINATLDVRSKPGHGTTIAARWTKSPAASEAHPQPLGKPA